jgi:farnesyl-diphosphate farnesyltransferase
MADLDDLLEKTSRTFALTIPLLPEPTRREVTLAYLLFRLADTFEDATVWPGERRIEALGQLHRLLNDSQDLSEVEARTQEWMQSPPDDRHAGYVELVAETPFVFSLFWDLGLESRTIIRRHLSRTIDGMSRYVATGANDADGGGSDSTRLELESLESLREYCYFVAGIVGEMLTDLYLEESPELAPSADYLRTRARSFGEALQLVNILKDSARDDADGRRYLPVGVEIAEVLALAKNDLAAAAEYTLELQRRGAARGLVAFNALPLLLARATLDRVADIGPGAKISRPEVYAIVAEMERALDADLPVV